MSYIRPLENDAGLYIYPEDYQIRFIGFPENPDVTISDEMLDILLYKISNNELERRKEHGKFLLRTLEDKDINTYNKNKNFWKEDRIW